MSRPSLPSPARAAGPLLSPVPPPAPCEDPPWSWAGLMQLCRLQWGLLLETWVMWKWRVLESV